MKYEREEEIVPALVGYWLDKQLMKLPKTNIINFAHNYTVAKNIITSPDWSNPKELLALSLWLRLLDCCLDLTDKEIHKEWKRKLFKEWLNEHEEDLIVMDINSVKHYALKNKVLEELRTRVTKPN